MNPAMAARGAADAAPPATNAPSLAEQVRLISEQLQHVAALALLSVPGETPEHGADHLIDGLAELEPDFARLRKTRALLPA